MKTEDVKLPGKRKRGRYSNEFKRELVRACEAPGVSTASVALANGVNANLLRRWISELRYIARARVENPQRVSANNKPEFVRLESTIRDTAAVNSKVELVLQRGEIRVLVSGSGTECAEFVRALFK
jgi:transposase-like protein